MNLIILALLLYIIIVLHTLGGCCKRSVTETMTTAGQQLKQAIADKTKKYKPSDDSSSADGTTQEGFSAFPYKTYEPDAINREYIERYNQSILDRPYQPVPPPKGQGLFDTTPFNYDCCPNTYSNSSGCACMTVDQYNYIKTRFGNNVPYSEY